MTQYEIMRDEEIVRSLLISLLAAPGGTDIRVVLITYRTRYAGAVSIPAMDIGRTRYVLRAHLARRAATLLEGTAEASDFIDDDEDMRALARALRQAAAESEATTA